MNLLLYQRPMQGTAPVMNLTPYVDDWTDATERIGGYTTGAFSIENKMGREELASFYDAFLGNVVKRGSYGMVRWEGLIYEMRLTVDGMTFVRSLAPEWWHNKVKIVYSDDIGSRAEVTWSEDTDSSDQWGEMHYLISLGGCTSAAATALQARHLAEYGWPRSRMVGNLSPVPSPARGGGARLDVFCAGFWSTLNWRYRETTLTDTASTCVSTFVAASEFVTAGRIETNALSTRCDAYPNPQRLGDLIRGIMEEGDSSGNIWQGGVYAGREFVYEQAPTSAKYQWRDGRLWERFGAEADPELVDAGQLVYNAAAPGNRRPGAGSNIWDDPHLALIDKVEFDQKTGVTLTLYQDTETGLLERTFPGALV